MSDNESHGASFSFVFGVDPHVPLILTKILLRLDPSRKRAAEHQVRRSVSWYPSSPGKRIADHGCIVSTGSCLLIGVVSLPSFGCLLSTPNQRCQGQK